MRQNNRKNMVFSIIFIDLLTYFIKKNIISMKLKRFEGISK